MSAVIDRGFVRLDAGLVHYRCAGQATTAPTLVMAHGGPGSSAGLAPLIASLAESRRVVAPDMMGAGDSDPPPTEPDIGFYADCLEQVLDRLECGRVDLYGHHTGAQVACELAIAHPERVRRVVLDGVALFPQALRAEFLARYAPKLEPDARGDHQQWVWDFISRTTQVFPHYSADPADRIVGGVTPPPAVVATRSAEVLKVWSTYHLVYRAAFTHDLAGRLPRVMAHTVILEVEGDPLALYAAQAASLIDGARLVSTTREGRVEALRVVLDCAETV